MFLKHFFRWREQRQLRDALIAETLWSRAVNEALGFACLDHDELRRLRELSSLFLVRKSINGAADLKVDDYMRVVIAAQACLLILNLDLDYFDGWVEIIVYPEAFVVTREVRDEFGIVHKRRTVLGGEAWSRGPLILSWEDARPNAHNTADGANVILHEFAHKLDMLDGSADGTPILHPDMKLRDWIKTFTASYDKLRNKIENRQRTRIDPYAAVNPAEFFAVVSEEFFMAPEKLHQYHAEIYRELQQFYRQDPLQRLQNRQ